MCVKRLWNVCVFFSETKSRYPIDYEIHLRSWVDMNVKQCVRICCPYCEFAWADMLWMIVLLHRARVFTCCDPFWLVFETLHLSFRFVSFAMPPFHIYSSVSFYLTSKTRDWNLSLHCCRTASHLLFLLISAFRLILFFPCTRLFNSIRCQSKYFSIWMCYSPSSWLIFEIDVAYLTSES